MGKASGSTANGSELYLQYGSSDRVYIGAGSGGAGLTVAGTHFLRVLSLLQVQFKVLHLVTEQFPELHLLMKTHLQRTAQLEFLLNNQLKHM